MRLHIISSLLLLAQIFAFGTVSAAPVLVSTIRSNEMPRMVYRAAETPSALTLTVDSIHHINCSRATGYLKVKASGGAPAYSYLWSNGTTGPVDAALTPGTYEITATDDNGTTTTLSVEITEDFTPPVADAGADFTATCANSVVALDGTASSTGAQFTYLWTAADGGQIQSGANTLTPTIKHVGLFTLKVTDITNGCTSTAGVKVDAIYEPPAVTATGGIFNCTVPVTLTSTYQQNNTVFVWNGPNGFVSHQLNPQVSVVGTFVFKVTDTLTTCLNTANAVVTADTSKPTALPIGGEINCYQPTLALGGTFGPQGITFVWKGPNNFNSTLPNPTVATAGTYQVTVTNPSNFCTASNTCSVTSNFLTPTATASVTGILTCNILQVQLVGGGTPMGITYSWTGPLGFSSNQQFPSVSTPGTYTLTTRIPQSGCTATAFVVVQSNTTTPGATATGGQKTCSNPSVTLQSSSSTQGVNFHWTGPNGYTSNQQNPVVSVAGLYTVMVTNPINGCTSTANATVTQNTTAPNVSATTTTVSCYVPNPQIVANSTTPGVTFSWVGPNGYTSNISNPTVTFGGSYTVTVLNPSNGCTAAKSIFVDENLSTPAAHAGEDRTLNCNFTSILANPIGTSTGSNISYLWTTWDGHIQSGATSLYARFDAIGHYTLTVKNSTSGCIAKDSMEVTQTPPFTVNAHESNPVSCFGGNNGAVTATPIGGSSPYTYIWSTGATTATLGNQSVGTFSVTVTDSEGCTATGSAAVTQPGALVANVSATNQTMVGVNNGTATVTPTGGAAPYSVHWNTGSSALNLMNLAPGAYSVTVTDFRGCTKSNTTNVNAVNCGINGEINAVHLNCAGVSTGSATAIVMGAPGPFTYLWSNSATTQTASNLAAGNYAVTVTSTNGCSTVLTTQITGPQLLQLAVVSNTSVSCSGLANGAATLNATGGTSPYTYNWSNGVHAASISGMGAGTYTCTVTDAHNCTTTQSVQITSPQPVTLAVSSKTDVPCVDGQTGSITMTAGGGTAPYSFLWSNNASGATASGLAVGNYICTVTDNRGCSKNQSAQISTTDNTPPQLILKNATVPLGSNGSATITPALFDNGSFDQFCNIVNWTVTPTSVSCGQLGTHTVTLTATDKNGNTATGNAVLTVIDDITPTITCPSNQSAAACAPNVTFAAPQIQDNCTVTGSATLVQGLPSGSAFPVGVTEELFSYTDAGGNTATCQFTVTVTGGVNGSVSTQPTSCSGNCDGSATLTISGNPVSVNWSNGQSGVNLAALCPGVYYATVTDGAGCSQVYEAQVAVQDAQAPVLFCPNNITVGYCAPSVTYTQPQVLDNCAVNMQQLQLVAGLPSGANFPIGQTTQLFRYTDGGGNTGECTFTVTVHLAASINSSAGNIQCAGSCDGSVSISVSGGQGPFGIIWSNGSVGPVIANLCPGVYSATVTDADGCQQTQMAQIMQPAPMQLLSLNTQHTTGNQSNGAINVFVSGGTAPYTYAWTFNGQAFSSSQNLAGLAAGTYELMVTDAHNCTFNSGPIAINGSVAVFDPENATDWTLTPNPASTDVWLELEAPLEEAMVRIFDLSGKMLLSKALTGTSLLLDVRQLPEGPVMVRIDAAQGSRSKILVISNGN